MADARPAGGCIRHAVNSLESGWFRGSARTGGTPLLTPMEAERRQITVLFADLVGFTAFSERAGEEAAFGLMGDLWPLMDDAVREQGGVVQDHTGDGIMAVFGVPVALEDAPLNACRAALSILQRLRTSGSDLEAKYGIRPHFRIGLNTGSAVVGRQGGADAAVRAAGDTVNYASRLQALATPNSVCMSEATYRLLQGRVEATFAGEQEIKGKSKPQKVYRLEAIRHGAARFEAAVSRGLSLFVGRERELEVLERGLKEARSHLCVVDIVAEPGMGKSRLLHEFRQRIGQDRAFVLRGSCSSETEQTPFFPFIEVVRGSFRISAGEDESDVAGKLDIGLKELGLHSIRNLGLLLHLLGLQVPDGALTGLDSVLIGLRTRGLLQQLLEARCLLSLVVMIVEDLHWIDSASEECLGKIVSSERKLRLLLLHTRRPEYAPSWLDRSDIIKLPLDPLSTSEIRRLVQTRLATDDLPERLARQVVDKAEGNPLFAEEIVSFLTERGMLHVSGGSLVFDPNAVTAALPGSVQGLLSARVDRLALKDRSLLQAASVIGRQFDPEFLAGLTGGIDVNARLAAMQALDLVQSDGKSGEYAFKHALVRDALYQSLLTDRRKALHFKIADEIERRSANRLTEVAEELAHHYSQTDHADKAFAYLSMAGSKSLSVYSLDEAATHLGAALSLLDDSVDCASDDQVAEFLVSYAMLSNLNSKMENTIRVLAHHLWRVDRLGDDPRAVLIRHQYVFALIWSARYREAALMQEDTSPIAERLGDSRSKAYSLAGEIHVSTMIAPKPLVEFEKLKNDAIKAASETTDSYIQSWVRCVIGWQEFHRGRITHARESARELMQVGRTLRDPRSTGLGLALLTIIAMVFDSYMEALEHSEHALAVALTPFDRSTARIGMGCALVLLRQTEEGAKLLDEERRRDIADGGLYALAATDGIIGVCRVLQGSISDGIRLLEEGILKREREGYRGTSDWYRLLLSETYLQIIGGNEKLPFLSILNNLPILLKVRVTASSRIRALLAHVLENPHFDPAGYFVGHAQMILGLLFKIEKKHALALQHLTEAKRILSAFGQSPMLARLDAALTELGQ
jgi:class 3 adenylate cyclase